MKPEPGSAAYFDNWYADMTTSPLQDEIQQRHLGLPPHLLSSSLLPWDGIAEVVAALRLSDGGTLVDLACGRGGYGLEIASRTGARLARVDLAAGLSGAGFGEVQVRDRPDWRARERAMWQEAAALDPSTDPALISFHEEALRSPLIDELTRRVMATATAP